MPVFILISTERGILQGLLRFDLYAVTLQVEVWVKFAGLLAAAFLGLGANGSAATLSLSVICGWFVAREFAKRMLPIPAVQKFTEISLLGQDFGPLLVVYFSQVVINNSDLLLVKSYYPADEAGHYAVLVLIGRIIFYGTWSATFTIFPIVAHRKARGEPHVYLFYGAFGFVAIIALVATLMAGIFSNQLIASAFGSQYLAIAPLLWRYAVATSLYALANVIVNYHIALGKTYGTFFVLGGGLLQIVGIILFHKTLSEVVLVQIVVMVALLVVLLGWHLTQMPESFIRPGGSTG